jgi:hypothetical protein
MNDYKKTVAVFTAWPELIQNQGQQFDLVFMPSCNQLIKDTFASDDVLSNLQRYVAWVHDRKWFTQFDFCLFVGRPCRIDVGDFLIYLDNEHSTYIDIDQEIILYRRSSQWQSKIVDIEKTSESLGIIFIDCWQQIADNSVWPRKAHGFNFYTDMKNSLSKYKVNNMVFHTGEFGSLPLATELIPWSQYLNSYHIMDIEDFRTRYKIQQIYEWIVVGAHWQRCTHDKPLGFHNLRELKRQDSKLKIYSHKECTVKFLNNDIDNPIVNTLDSQDYAGDRLSWKPNGNLFELVTE